MIENEKVLLDRCCTGDAAAFETLISSYQKKVYNIAYRMLGNIDDASEIAQEVFIKVFKSIRQFKGEAAFSTWVYKITVNMCLDELRKRKKSRAVYIDEAVRLEDGEVEKQIPGELPGPEEMAEKNELRKIVENAIRRLDEKHRCVIVLRDIQGMSYEEIAQILNCPSGTIKSRINRARAALKDMLSSQKELFIREYVK